MRKTFQALRASGDYRRRHMPFVETLDDLDIVREIGFGQELGRPVSLKQLFLQGISSVATIQRRLARLKQLGIVQQSKAEHDKRVAKLTLSQAALKVFHGWGQQLRRELGGKAPPEGRRAKDRRASAEDRRASARLGATRTT